MKILIERFDYQEKQTLGRLTVWRENKIVCEGVTLELPWLENAKQISCIPEGEYNIELFNSVKFGKCFHVKDVPGRDAILIHRGNYNSDTHGCILPGERHQDINADGLADVIMSGVKMHELLNCWDGSGVLIITT